MTASARNIYTFVTFRNSSCNFLAVSFQFNICLLCRERRPALLHERSERLLVFIKIARTESPVLYFLRKGKEMSETSVARSPLSDTRCTQTIVCNTATLEKFASVANGVVRTHESLPHERI